MDTAGEGEGGMNRENSMETYTLPYVKDTASGDLLSHGELTPVLCDNLEGWEQGGSGKGGSGRRGHVYA